VKALKLAKDVGKGLKNTVKQMKKSDIKIFNIPLG
jgi:dihydroxyacetone kinase DhaKLM complex PTS-EIIA-like component DhaM